jgi:hypothetical protein
MCSWKRWYLYQGGVPWDVRVGSHGVCGCGGMACVLNHAMVPRLSEERIDGGVRHVTREGEDASARSIAQPPANQPSPYYCAAAAVCMSSPHCRAAAAVCMLGALPPYEA